MENISAGESSTLLGMCVVWCRRRRPRSPTALRHTPTGAAPAPEASIGRWLSAAYTSEPPGSKVGTRRGHLFLRRYRRAASEGQTQCGSFRSPREAPQTPPEAQKPAQTGSDLRGPISTAPPPPHCTPPRPCAPLVPKATVLRSPYSHITALHWGTQSCSILGTPEVTCASGSCTFPLGSGGVLCIMWGLSTPPHQKVASLNAPPPPPCPKGASGQRFVRGPLCSITGQPPPPPPQGHGSTPPRQGQPSGMFDTGSKEEDFRPRGGVVEVLWRLCDALLFQGYSQDT